MKHSKIRAATGTAVAVVCLWAGDIARADHPRLTRATGAPVGDNQNSTTAGPSGPVMLQDLHLIEKLASFDRERIPERVVHARGTGAHGTFTATADLGDLTRAAPFAKKGKKTEVFVRFSSVIHPKGSPETLRDPRGFAVKFYTEEGNWDLVGNNLPVFFIRDAVKFPDMVHSLKPDPTTNLQDPNRFFDFFSHVPESIHMFTRLYSRLGIPTSYREMDGSGVHAFKFVTDKCEWNYVKFTWKSRQGNNGLSVADAARIQANDFNHHTRDLYEHISAGDFPIWDLYIQVLAPQEVDSFDFNPLDATKTWPEDRIPLRKVGEMTLDRVPDNFFQSTEQVAVAPSNLIPGIEPSEDRLLQGRLFSYADTQRYRLGVNHLNIPINAPRTKVRNHQQDGTGVSAPHTGSVNYQPSRSGRGYVDDTGYESCRYELRGTIQQQPIAKTLNFAQAGDRWRSLSEEEKGYLIEAFGGDLTQVKSDEVRHIIASFTYKADPEYGTRLAAAARVNVDEARKLADSYTD